MTTAVNPADLSASVSRHHVEPGELGTMLKRSLRCSVPPDAVEMQGRHGMANWSFHVVVVAVKSFAAMLHEVSRWHSILMPPASPRLTACCGRETGSK
ncbi:uncharacterized protein CLUP02_04465 [Colletotrichum lupini]|uniref:Uncharacterized protein n=2 Tax=Colletotrichum acutatum species complex TaxID=2707335 RepID=A0A9Q8SLC7_9PEZI|nr:uncharacterized protein CLUP02_04465 [Colletotrichum lupini]XP_060308733.1 uncharacterized protein CCOS01_12537 [Colletotrichum costaricense]KAK1516988.1 hypothetical protein CCOS01_12537 [Colletotrichum costaricense]UQC78986.1 hypothetical protein CLUP02_04465 [Colletotrichum lupini]